MNYSWCLRIQWNGCTRRSLWWCWMDQWLDCTSYFCLLVERKIIDVFPVLEYDGPTDAFINHEIISIFVIFSHLQFFRAFLPNFIPLLSHSVSKNTKNVSLHQFWFNIFCVTFWCARNVENKLSETFSSRLQTNSFKWNEAPKQFSKHKLRG